jgi:hypothetical protein
MKKIVATIWLSFACISFTYTDDIDSFDPNITVLTGTVYNPEISQCDSDPFTTADMSRINLKKLKNKEIRWVALSRDLLKRWGGSIDYGDSIFIVGGEKEGWWVVHDCMNKRYKNRIDFLEYKQKRFKEDVKILSIRKK